MNNDNAKTAVSPTSHPGAPAADRREANRIQDAAIRIASTSLPILTALPEWRVVDGLVAATSLPTLQRDGHFYASTQPNDATVALDATHVTQPDQVNLRHYQVKQSLDANPLSHGASYRDTRCPLRSNAP